MIVSGYYTPVDRLSTQLEITCSKSTMEKLEQWVKFVQSKRKNKSDVNDIVLESLLLTLNRFYPLPWCFCYCL